MIETRVLCLFLAAMPLEQFSALGVTILKLAGGLAFVAWLFGRLRSLDPIRWDPGLTLMVLFVVWGIASGLWSVNPAQTVGLIPTYALLLLSYFLIVNVIRSERQLSSAMIALWLGTLVLLTSGAMGVVDNLSGRSFRVSGTLDNPNNYAAMLVACIPAGYWFFTRSRAPLRRTLTGVTLALAVITGLYSLSRGGAISIVVFLLSLLVFRQSRRRGFAIAILIVALSVRIAPLAFWERWEETRTEGGDVRTRELWPAGLKALAERPLLGSGLGTNGDALYQIRGTTRGGRLVHNAPLAVAMELGLPGLAFYLGFIAYSLVRLLRALTATLRQGRSKEAGFAIVLFASFVGYMTNWFKGGGMEYAKMLWVFLGLMSVYARMLEQPPDEPAATSEAGLDAVE